MQKKIEKNLHFQFDFLFYGLEIKTLAEQRKLQLKVVICSINNSTF